MTKITVKHKRTIAGMLKKGQKKNIRIKHGKAKPKIKMEKQND